MAKIGERYDEFDFGDDMGGVDEFNVVDEQSINEVAEIMEAQEEGADGKRKPSALQAIITRQVEEAIDHRDSKVLPDLETATSYYMGEPFGDEVDGRSKVVSTDVRDAVLAQMPSLLRIVFGPERMVEFLARRKEKIAEAELQTKYVNFVATEDNKGFLNVYSWLQDGLVRRIGVAKWWYEPLERVQSRTFRGLSQQQLVILANDPAVVEIEQGEESVDISTGQPIPVFEAKVTYKLDEGCVRWAPVPIDEFVFTPGTRDLGETPLVGHVRTLRVDQLRALDVPEELITKHLKSGNEDDSELEIIRNHEIYDDHDSSEADPSQREVLYGDIYALVEGDGDGIAELRHFKVVGDTYEIANGEGEVVSHAPFAAWSPIPEAHSLIGLSTADLLMDVQKLKSHMWRRSMESLTQATDPKTEIVEGMVNMEDFLNPSATGGIRVKAPGQMREVKSTFIGGDVLPMLQAMDSVKEDRTGVSKAAAGLDADSLQSSTKAAVAATISGSQQRLEMIARAFAEMGLAPLFKGLLQTTIEYQSRTRMMRFNGEYVEVDPRTWDADVDLKINVAIGQGPPEERIAAAGMIYQELKSLKYEVGVPFVTNIHLYNAIAQVIKLSGQPVDLFLEHWDEQKEQQYQQMLAQNPPQPDPAMAMVQVERERAMAEIQIKQAELSIKEWEAQQKNDRERDEMVRTLDLKEREIEAKYAVDIDDNQRRQAVDTERARLDADAKVEVAKNKPAPKSAGGDK